MGKVRVWLVNAAGPAAVEALAAGAEVVVDVVDPAVEVVVGKRQD